MSKHPEVLWAQRSSASNAEKNIIYLTVNLPDIIESTLQYALTASSVSFKARTTSGGETEYAFNLDLFAEVDPEKSTRRLTSRSLVVILRKKASESGYWPRLTKEKLKAPFIKTDFGKWVDEDEQDGAANANLDDEFGDGGFPGGGDIDFSKLASDYGAASSPPDADDERADTDDDDDDGPPPLEDAEPSK